MLRSPPEPESEEISLYITTYYSLLRSSGEVRVRAFEEAHAYSGSSLHAGALADEPTSPHSPMRQLASPTTCPTSIS